MSIRYHRARLGAAVVVAFVCGLVFASGFDLTHFSWAQARVNTAASKPTAAQIASAAETETAFEAVVDHARPAVVSIETERFAKRTRPATQQLPRGRRLPPGIEDFFRQFDQPPSDQPEEASGSGFIVSDDGYILTNNHVVADADKVTVTLYDKRVFENAKVVGRDSTTDVAVIKIDAKDLPTVSLGDDTKARVGQWVLAIGNPLQLDFTVTAGIVSAKGRNKARLLNPDGRSNPYAITDYIQTDAAINPGNSGGPLLNIQGEVIGINSAIASGTGYYAGYGFAIPITLAKQVMEDLIKYGEIRPAVLGVTLNEVDANDARAAGLAHVGGAKVVGFPDDNSPAHRAGVQIGDLIVAAGGHSVDQVSTLQRIIRGYKPGDMVNLDVNRFGEKKTFKIKLGERSELRPVAAQEQEDSSEPAADESGARHYDKLGISVTPLPPELVQREHIAAEFRKGVLITSVSPRGPSWNSLGAQEIIVSRLYPKPQRDIQSTSDLQDALSAVKPGDVITFKVYDIPNAQTRVVSIAVAK